MISIQRIGATLGLVLAVAACSHTPEETPAGSVEPAKKAPAAAPAPVTAEPRGATDDHCDGKEASPDSVKVETIATGASPSRGLAAAPVTIVVFSDFECSYCAKGERTLREVEAAYPGKVRLVFKNAPLPMHTHARLAAKAALAAGEQGKFWEYHDALFEQQDSLDRPGLEAAAQKLGLEMARFRASLDSPKL